jgi:hypothetical protein
MYLSCIQVTFCQMGYHFITYVPSIYVFKESQYVPVYIQTTLREKARWALCVECIHHKVICNMYLLSYTESQYVPVYIQTTLREKARWALCVECIHHKVICDMYLLSYTDYIMRSSQKGCIYTCRVMKYHVILRYVPVFSHTDYIMQTVKVLYTCADIYVI